jgi:hypothetical protein
MDSLTLSNSSTSSQFRVVSSAIEVRDENGVVLGTFVPRTTPYGVDSPCSDEELNRRMNESGRTLPEIWKALGRT